MDIGAVASECGYHGHKIVHAGHDVGEFPVEPAPTRLYSVVLLVIAGLGIRNPGGTLLLFPRISVDCVATPPPLPPPHISRNSSPDEVYMYILLTAVV